MVTMAKVKLSVKYIDAFENSVVSDVKYTKKGMTYTTMDGEKFVTYIDMMDKLLKVI